MNRRCCADVVDGEELPGLQVRVTRTDLVRYAGASGDFNPIHWSDRAAHEAGLPDIVAHGMLTMALANRLVTAWAGDPAVEIEALTDEDLIRAALEAARGAGPRDVPIGPSSTLFRPVRDV